MYPAVGALIWVVLGALVGWFAGHVLKARAGEHARQVVGASIAVGILGAILGGFISTIAHHGDANPRGCLFCIGIAFLSACVASVVHALVPHKLRTVR